MALRVRSMLDLPPELRKLNERVMDGRDAPRRVPVPVTEEKPAKFGNVRVVVDGMRFPSKLEAKCYEYHKLRVKWGEVSWFIRQVPFHLTGGVIYRADFLAVLTQGGVEVTDSKGYDTQSSRNKRRQVKELYGVDVRLWPAR